MSDVEYNPECLNDEPGAQKYTNKLRSADKKKKNKGRKKKAKVVDMNAKVLLQVAYYLAGKRLDSVGERGLDPTVSTNSFAYVFLYLCVDFVDLL